MAMIIQKQATHTHITVNMTRCYVQLNEVG